MLEKSLTEFGLSSNEAKVYLAALELGQSLASTLGKKTGINRSTVYMIIQSLKKKGLLGVFEKNGIDYFSPSDPDVFLLKEEQAVMAQQVKFQKVQDLVIQLHAGQKNSFYVPKVKFYEGIDGIKQLYEDTLKVKETIYAVESIDAMPSPLKKYIFDHYVPKRVKLNIFAYVITMASEQGKLFQCQDEESNRETILVDRNNYPFHMEMNIYGNKVAFMSYKNEKYMGVIVDNQQIAETMISFFNLTWNLLKNNHV